MQTNQEIFMLVAEEMSISRAAERAFVSQQCVSNHIKRMEQQYNILLFTRKPRFQLTQAGWDMLHSLQKIRAIEQNLQERFLQYTDGIKGSFTMGIHHSRAQILLPWVLPQYHQDFPDIEISFYMNDTVILEKYLREGHLDLFLGVNCPYSEDLSFLPVCQDEIRFFISDGLLKKYFSSAAEGILSQEIDLNDFIDIPFVKNMSTSVMSAVFQEYLDKQHLALQFPYRISDTDTQISLCAKGLGAGIAPSMLLSRIYSHNKSCSPEEYLHILPLKNFRKGLRLDLISLKCVEKPYYITAFEQKIVEAVHQNYLSRLSQGF